MQESLDFFNPSFRYTNKRLMDGRAVVMVLLNGLEYPGWLRLDRNTALIFVPEFSGTIAIPLDAPELVDEENNQQGN